MGKDIFLSPEVSLLESSHCLEVGEIAHDPLGVTLVTVSTLDSLKTDFTSKKVITSVLILIDASCVDGQVLSASLCKLDDSSLHELELAQKISDKILCVKDSYVEKFGSPDEIFGDGYIAELFDLTAGSFDDESGNAELMKVEGEPEVFVIAGNGLGRRLYHRLQREGIAFATGILYKNDWDYPVAKALAVKRIEAEAFEPMSDEAFEEAKKILAGCKKVICCKNDGDFGTYEQKNKELLQYARAQGIELELLNDI